MVVKTIVVNLVRLIILFNTKEPVGARAVMSEIIFGFGKFKGKAVSEVLEIEPSYVVWAVGKGLITIDQKTLRNATDAHHDECCYAEAVFESEHGDWGDRD